MYFYFFPQPLSSHNYLANILIDFALYSFIISTIVILCIAATTYYHFHFHLALLLKFNFQGTYTILNIVAGFLSEVRQFQNFSGFSTEVFSPAKSHIHFVLFSNIF